MVPYPGRTFVDLQLKIVYTILHKFHLLNVKRFEWYIFPNKINLWNHQEDWHQLFFFLANFWSLQPIQNVCADFAGQKIVAVRNAISSNIWYNQTLWARQQLSHTHCTHWMNHTEWRHELKLQSDYRADVLCRTIIISHNFSTMLVFVGRSLKCAESGCRINLVPKILLLKQIECHDGYLFWLCASCILTFHILTKNTMTLLLRNKASSACITGTCESERIAEHDTVRSHILWCHRNFLLAIVCPTTMFIRLNPQVFFTAPACAFLFLGNSSM